MYIVHQTYICIRLGFCHILHFIFNVHFNLARIKHIFIYAKLPFIYDLIADSQIIIFMMYSLNVIQINVYIITPGRPHNTQ